MSNYMAAGYLSIEVSQGKVWAYLDCGSSWYWYSLPEITARLSRNGRWAQVLDEARKDPHKRDHVPRYLAWLPEGRTQPPSWGGHVSVIRGEILNPNSLRLLRNNQNRMFWFEYNPNLIRSRDYWYHKVRSPDLEDFRIELGLRPSPSIPYHLTVAVMEGR